jgi:hypothetical protein
MKCNKLFFIFYFYLNISKGITNRSIGFEKLYWKCVVRKLRSSSGDVKLAHYLTYIEVSAFSQQYLFIECVLLRGNNTKHTQRESSQCHRILSESDRFVSLTPEHYCANRAKLQSYQRNEMAKSALLWSKWTDKAIKSRESIVAFVQFRYIYTSIALEVIVILFFNLNRC